MAQNASYYQATRNSPPEAPHAATGNLTCDVCVVGGGYTGLSAALALAEKQFDVVLLEGRDIGDGASGRNGGQVGSAHTVLQPRLQTVYGPVRARALWDLSERAKALVKQLIRTHEISCDYTPGNMGCAVTESSLDAFKRHVDMVRDLYGYDAYEIHDRAEVAALCGSPIYCGAMNDPSAGHVHPLNLALGLADAARKAGVRIHCQSPARSIEAGAPARVYTVKARITAGQVILAWNGYLPDITPGLAPDQEKCILPIDNFQVATEPLDEETYASVLTNNACFWDSHNQVYYYRKTRDRRLTFGGGLRVPNAPPRDAKAFTRRHLLKVFPQLAPVAIDFAWGGTLAATRSGLPSIGVAGPGVRYSLGYSGHGVALATLCGRLMAESIIGPSSGFDLLAGIAPKPYRLPAFLRGPVLRAGFAHLALMDAIRGLR